MQWGMEMGSTISNFSNSLASGLTLNEYGVLGIGLFMIVLFIWDRLRQDIVALMVLVCLGVFHLLPSNQLFLGFSSDAVIALIAVMVLGKGIEKAGLVSMISSFIVRRSEGKANRAFLYLAVFSGVLSGFFRSLGGFALLMPVIHRLSLYFGVPRAKWYLPLGFCAIVGGTLTLVGSGPMLMVTDLMKHSGLGHFKPIGFFTVTPIGICLLVGVIAFFLMAGLKLLPDPKEEKMGIGMDPEVFRRTYGYGGRFYELKLSLYSPLRDMTVKDIESLIGERNICLLAVATNGEIQMPPLRKSSLTPSSRIAVVGDEESIKKFAEENYLKIREGLKVFADILNPMRSGFGEIIIPPGSALIGQKMSELHMRRQHSVQVLAVFRGQRFYHGEEMKQITMRSGDALGIFCQWDALQLLEKHHELAIVTTEYPQQVYLRHRMMPALGCCLISLLSILFTDLSIAICLLLGAILMVLLNIVEMDEAYKSISWKTVFLMAGLIPFGVSIQESGLANHISGWILDLFGPNHWFWVLSVLVLIAGLSSLLMTNVGATVALVPIAMTVANSIHADPRMFAIVTALGTSNAFVLPTHQVSTLISGGGGYRLKDFIGVGLWVTLVYWVILMGTAVVFLA